MPKPVGELGRRHGQRHRRARSSSAASAPLFAIPIGVLSGVYIVEYGRDAAGVGRRGSPPTRSTACRRSSSACSSTPSPCCRSSSSRALAGGIALGVMMIPDHRAHDRGAAAAGADVAARGRAGARRHARRARCSPSCCRPRCRASSRASCWRWRASPARRRRCSSPSFNNRFWSTALDQPIAYADRPGLHLRDLAVRRLAPAGLGRRAGPGGLVLVCSLLARLATRRLERMHRQ